MLGKCFGYSACHSVGIGVENITLTIMRQRGYYRNDTTVEQLCQTVSISIIYIPHITKIDHFIGAIIHFYLLQGAFVGTYYVHVGTCESECIDTLCLQLCHDVFVYQSAIYHGDNREHLCISNPASTHHAAFYAKLCGYLRCSSSTTMHQYFLAFY